MDKQLFASSDQDPSTSGGKHQPEEKDGGSNDEIQELPPPVYGDPVVLPESSSSSRPFPLNVVGNLVPERVTSLMTARHVLALMGFLGMFNVYALRTNLNVAIVAMVTRTHSREVGGDVTEMCPDLGGGGGGNSTTDQVVQDGFDWDYNRFALALGAYFYGYIVTNIPGAWAAKKFGFKRVLGFSMLLSSVITFLTPASVRLSFELFVFVRILLGLLQGVAFPAMQGAWGVWSPPLERSFLVSVHVAGASFGNVVTAPLAGFIAQDYGWDYVFYITGGMALAWTVVWFLIIHDSPGEHPRISEEERRHIEDTIRAEKKKENEIRMTPWGKMFTSLPLLAILSGHFASNWGNYTLLNLLPTYMTHVLKFDIKSSGLYTAMPFVLQLLVAIGGGRLTDYLLERKRVSVLRMRKINTAVGLVVPAVAIVLAGYVRCQWQAALAFFTISVALNALTIPGCKANSLDIAPRYAGILYGISNTVANIPGFLASQVAGLLLDLGNGSISQWQLSFWVVAVVYMVGTILYLIFASADLQPWAEGKIVTVPDAELRIEMAELKAEDQDA